MKYHVVPTIYRQNLPDELKLHKSHDIVLLCLNCHEKANKFAEALRENLALTFGVPTNLFAIEYQINNKTAYVIKLSTTLFYQSSNLSEQKKQQLSENLSKAIKELTALDSQN
jgi:hypothetical protein